MSNSDDQQPTPSRNPDWLRFTLAGLIGALPGFAAGFLMGRLTAGSGERPSETVNPPSERPDPDEIRTAIEKELRHVRDKSRRERFRRLLDRALGSPGPDGRGDTPAESQPDDLLDPFGEGGGEGAP